jgi:hypothetical protein
MCRSSTRSRSCNLATSDRFIRFGLNISNIGAKMSYTETAKPGLHPDQPSTWPPSPWNLDEYNSDITFAFDANKLLVPTPPIYLCESIPAATISWTPRPVQFQIACEPDVGVAHGFFGPSAMRPERELL